MTRLSGRLAAASALAAALLLAPAASADQAQTDCAALKTIVDRDEAKLDTDAQGLSGHIHTLIHAARLVSADADAEAGDIAAAHVSTAGLSTDAASYAGALRSLSGALKTLIATLSPLAGSTARGTGLHQRIQAVTGDVQQRCSGQTPSADCNTLLAKMKEFSKDETGGPSAMADRAAAYAASVTSLALGDPNLQKDATEWASIFHDMATGLRGVAAFQTAFQSIQQKADASSSAAKSFCSQHQ